MKKVLIILNNNEIMRFIFEKKFAKDIKLVFANEKNFFNNEISPDEYDLVYIHAIQAGELAPFQDKAEALGKRLLASSLIKIPELNGENIIFWDNPESFSEWFLASLN